MDSTRTNAEAARLLPLARTVLDRYPFEVKEVKHLATHSNALFRVVADDGRLRVLRVGSPHANTRTNMEYEVAWLAALDRDTDLEVVTPIPTGYGGLIVEIEDEEGETRSCVLFSWVPGQPLTDKSGTFGYRLLGGMSAALHDHGREWRPKNPERLRTWDRVFYYDPVLDPVVIGDSRLDHLFTRRRRSVIDRAGASAEAVVKDEWATGLSQIVHGDLHEWNVHVGGSRLYAFDFEDVMLATPAQDVSISLYSSRTSVRVDDIRAAFRRGYEEIATWPIESDEQVDGLHAARQIMLMNYAARTLPLSESTSYVEQVMPWLEAYVDKYC